MVFDGEILNGDLLFSRRRRTSRRRKKKLKANVRMGGRKGAGPGRARTAVFILVPVVFVVLCALVWMGMRTAVSVLFSRNDTFTLTNLEIRGGGVVVRDFVRGKKRLREGINLFSVDMEELRREFLRDAPSFKSMALTRYLPGTLVVEATERTPLAHIGKRGPFVVDSDGFVFSLGGQNRHLPEIHGYRGAKLKPSLRLQGVARDAIVLLDTWQKLGLGKDVMVRTVDISGGFGARDGSMRLTLDQGTAVLFWWRRVRSRHREPSTDLEERLLFLRGALRKARDSGKPPPRVLNLTLDSYKSNIPAVF